MGTAWRLPDGQELRWRSWDGEYLLYHANSGDTHRLNAVGAAVLSGIAAGSVETAELVERIARELQLETNAIHEAIVDLLARFEDLGLVEPVDEPGPRADSARDR